MFRGSRSIRHFRVLVPDERTREREQERSFKVSSNRSTRALITKDRSRSKRFRVKSIRFVSSFLSNAMKLNRFSERTRLEIVTSLEKRGNKSIMDIDRARSKTRTQVLTYVFFRDTSDATPKYVTRCQYYRIIALGSTRIVVTSVYRTKEYRALRLEPFLDLFSRCRSFGRSCKIYHDGRNASRITN